MIQDSSAYRLVFDARDAGFTDLGLMVLAIAVLIAGIVLSLLRTRSPYPRWTGFGLVGFGLLASGILVQPYMAHRALVAELTEGRATSVEGSVRNFAPGDEGDHRLERWEVLSNGQIFRYAYSPSRLEPGYRQTKPHGGLIDDGVRVRLLDVDGHIARLEIAR